MQTFAEPDSGTLGMIVKRVSVPIGLEELMEGLTKEVLVKKPKDLYVFASEYFARLVILRERHSNHKAYYPIRTAQSVTHLRTPGDMARGKKMTVPKATKPKISEQAEPIRNVIQKNRERKQVAQKENALKEVSLKPTTKSSSTPRSVSSVQSTPREKRQRSTSRTNKDNASAEQHKPSKTREAKRDEANEPKSGRGGLSVSRRGPKKTPIVINEKNVAKLEELGLVEEASTGAAIGVIKETKNEEKQSMLDVNIGEKSLTDPNKLAKDLETADNDSTDPPNDISGKFSTNQSAQVNGVAKNEDDNRINATRSEKDVAGIADTSSDKKTGKIEDAELKIEGSGANISTLKDDEKSFDGSGVNVSTVADAKKSIDGIKEEIPSKIDADKRIEDSAAIVSAVEDAKKSIDGIMGEIDSKSDVDKRIEDFTANVSAVEDAKKSIDGIKGEIDSKSDVDKRIEDSAANVSAVEDVKTSIDGSKEEIALGIDAGTKTVAVALKERSVEDTKKMPEDNKEEITIKSDGDIAIKDSAASAKKVAEAKKEINEIKEEIASKSDADQKNEGFNVSAVADGDQTTESKHEISSENWTNGGKQDKANDNNKENPENDSGKEEQNQAENLSTTKDVKIKMEQKSGSDDVLIVSISEKGAQEDTDAQDSQPQPSTEPEVAQKQQFFRTNKELASKEGGQVKLGSNEARKRLDSPTKASLKAFLTNEQQHVFKTTAKSDGDGSVSAMAKTKKEDEEIERNPTTNPKHTVFSSVKELLDNTVDNWKATQHTSSEQDDSSSNNLQLIIKETDSSDANTNASSRELDSVATLPSITGGLRVKRSVTGDDVEDIASSEEGKEKPPKMADISGEVRGAEVEGAKQFYEKNNSAPRVGDDNDIKSSIKIDGNQDANGKMNATDNASDEDRSGDLQETARNEEISAGDDEIDEAQNALQKDRLELEAVSTSLTKELTKSNGDADAKKDTYGTTEPTDETEMESQAISKENTFIKTNAKPEAQRKPKIGDIDQMASVIEVVKPPTDLAALRSELHKFLQNEQQHVFQSSKGPSDNKTKRIKLTLKQERSLSQANIIENGVAKSGGVEAKVRRAKSVGVLRTREEKSKIPTPLRRSAGRRPLIRQSDANSKELEEKLNFYNKQNSNEGGALAKDDPIAKTILTNVQGVEKHIELIEEHFKKSDGGRVGSGQNDADNLDALDVKGSLPSNKGADGVDLAGENDSKEENNQGQYENKAAETIGSDFNANANEGKDERINAISSEQLGSHPDVLLGKGKENDETIDGTDARELDEVDASKKATTDVAARDIEVSKMLVKETDKKETEDGQADSSNLVKNNHEEFSPAEGVNAELEEEKENDKSDVEGIANEEQVKLIEDVVKRTDEDAGISIKSKTSGETNTETSTIAPDKAEEMNNVKSTVESRSEDPEHSIDAKLDRTISVDPRIHNGKKEKEESQVDDGGSNEATKSVVVKEAKADVKPCVEDPVGSIETIGVDEAKIDQTVDEEAKIQVKTKDYEETKPKEERKEIQLSVGNEVAEHATGTIEADVKKMRPKSEQRANEGAETLIETKPNEETKAEDENKRTKDVEPLVINAEGLVGKEEDNDLKLGVETEDPGHSISKREVGFKELRTKTHEKANEDAEIRSEQERNEKTTAEHKGYQTKATDTFGVDPKNLADKEEKEDIRPDVKSSEAEDPKHSIGTTGVDVEELHSKIDQKTSQSARAHILAEESEEIRAVDNTDQTEDLETLTGDSRKISEDPVPFVGTAEVAEINEKAPNTVPDKHVDTMVGDKPKAKRIEEPESGGHESSKEPEGKVDVEIDGGKKEEEKRINTPKIHNLTQEVDVEASESGKEEAESAKANRGNKTDDEAREELKNHEELKKLEEKAATKIQSVWKGFVVRKLMSEPNQHGNTKRSREQAIIQIQAVVRGFLERIRFGKLKAAIHKEGRVESVAKIANGKEVVENGSVDNVKRHNAAKVKEDNGGGDDIEVESVDASANGKRTFENEGADGVESDDVAKVEGDNGDGGFSTLNSDGKNANEKGMVENKGVVDVKGDGVTKIQEDGGGGDVDTLKIDGRNANGMGKVENGIIDDVKRDNVAKVEAYNGNGDDIEVQGVDADANRKETLENAGAEGVESDDAAKVEDSSTNRLQSDDKNANGKGMVENKGVDNIKRDNVAKNQEDRGDVDVDTLKNDGRNANGRGTFENGSIEDVKRDVVAKVEENGSDGNADGIESNDKGATGKGAVESGTIDDVKHVNVAKVKEERGDGFVNRLENVDSDVKKTEEEPKAALNKSKAEAIDKDGNLSQLKEGVASDNKTSTSVDVDQSKADDNDEVAYQPKTGAIEAKTGSVVVERSSRIENIGIAAKDVQPIENGASLIGGSKESEPKKDFGDNPTLEIEAKENGGEISFEKVHGGLLGTERVGTSAEIQEIHHGSINGQSGCAQGKEPADEATARTLKSDKRNTERGLVESKDPGEEINREILENYKKSLAEAHIGSGKIEPKQPAGKIRSEIQKNDDDKSNVDDSNNVEAIKKSLSLTSFENHEESFKSGSTIQESTNVDPPKSNSASSGKSETKGTDFGTTEGADTQTNPQGILEMELLPTEPRIKGNQLLGADSHHGILLNSVEVVKEPPKDKPEFYRTNTVMEPSLVKKIAHQLGDQKDDNNNSSKEETQLEKEVRATVRGIVHGGKPLVTPLETEISQAVKSIMENNVDDPPDPNPEDSNAENAHHEHLEGKRSDSDSNRTLSIDRVLRNLPEVPTDEIVAPKGELTNRSTQEQNSTENDQIDDMSSVGSMDSVVTVVLKPKKHLENSNTPTPDPKPPNKRLPGKALSTSALEDHVEMIDQAQNSLLDQLSGKTSGKFDIDQLRKELYDHDDHHQDRDQEVMEYLYDFHPEDGEAYDPRALRELPDIAEEAESKEDDLNGAVPLQVTKPNEDRLRTSDDDLATHQKLLHTSELHDTVFIPVNKTTSSATNLEVTKSLKHTSEFHDTVVVPLSGGADVRITNASKDMVPSNATTESGNQTAPVQQAPAGVEVVTSRNGGVVGGGGDAQASLKDAAPTGPESSGSFATHQSPPRSVERAMESESKNSRRNNNAIAEGAGKNMESQAATKIQAGFRGYQVRKQLKAKNAAVDQKRQLRKRSSRENMKEQDLEEKSAVKIQAGVRGFLVRRRQKKQVNSSASA